MGVEFRLGRQDGRKAEDFLARRPAGVSAITLDTVYARYQHDAADAARAIGAQVFYDPATERMADLGFTPAGVDFAGDPFDVRVLAVDPSARARLVDGVLTAHPDVTTIGTPPHFYVHDDRSAALNVALAEHTAQQSDKPVRADPGDRAQVRRGPGAAPRRRVPRRRHRRSRPARDPARRRRRERGEDP